MFRIAGATTGKPLVPGSADFVRAQLDGRKPVGWVTPLEPRSFEILSQLKPGDTVTIPLTDRETVAGKVQFATVEPDVVSVIGPLVDRAGSFSFEREARGVRGVIMLPKEGRAYRVEQDAAGKVVSKEVSLDDVICVPAKAAPVPVMTPAVVKPASGLAASSPAAAKPASPFAEAALPAPTKASLVSEAILQSAKLASGAGAQAPQGSVAAASAAAPAPILNSRPSATVQLYLNFDGETVSGTQWNTETNGANPIVAAPSGLTASEITAVFNEVAEYYRPFEVNITTDFARYTLAPKNQRYRCVITPTNIAGGGDPKTLGIAYSNFGSLGPSTISWAFTHDVGEFSNGGSSAVAVVIAHELGHTFMLGHDGLPTEGYFTGHGQGNVNMSPPGFSNIYNDRWGPIMGSPFKSVGYVYQDGSLVRVRARVNVAQWSKGEYQSANNPQDDVTTIAQSISAQIGGASGYIADEAGNTRAAAAPLSPGGVMDQSGIITSAADVDFFVFNTLAGGWFDLGVFFSSTPPTPNLDVALEIQNSSGALVASSNPEGPYGASLATDLGPGTYYIKISGSGAWNPLTDGYSNYGSIGAYVLFGSGNFSRSPPYLTLPTISNLTPTSATVASTVSSDNGAPVTERGFVYAATATNPDPFIGGPGVIPIAITGSFSANISTLILGTNYTFRAYATNSVGTSYSEVVGITRGAVPALYNPSSTYVSSSSLKVSGSLLSEGGSPVTETGVVLSLKSVNPDPRIGGTGVSKLISAPRDQDGKFEVNLTGLAPGSTYALRTYAANSSGWGYCFFFYNFTVPGNPVFVGAGEFESPVTGSFQYNPPVTATQLWTFSSASGVAIDGPAFGVVGSSTGQYAFIQSGATISQSMTFPTAGTYGLIYKVATRDPATGGGNVTFSTTLSGGLIARTGSFPAGTGFLQHTEFFAVTTPGNYTLTFANTTPSANGDQTYYVDSVLITRTPVAISQGMIATEETANSITLSGTDPDGDTLSQVGLGVPAHGRLTQSGFVVNYTPDWNYSGTDSFDFFVVDSHGVPSSSNATVAVTVDAVNDAPAFTLPPGTVTGLAGGTWAPKGSGSRNWTSIASSSDGSRLVAVQNGGSIYTSVDFGRTWSPRDVTRNWVGVTSSADGTKLAALVGGLDKLYTSTDAGVNWTVRSAPVYGVSSIASSSDGTKLAATASNGYIYTSTNSGVNWIQRATSGSRAWTSITSSRDPSSSDGTKLAATVNNGQIYTSADAGVSWTAQASGSRAWTSITSSSDATKLAATVNGGQIYTSTNSGVTWTAQASGTRSWRSIASSSDGTKLIAAADGAQIYTSSNSGVSWIASESSRAWRAVATSADGSKLIAGADAGDLYTSAAPETAYALSVYNANENTTTGFATNISGGPADESGQTVSFSLSNTNYAFFIVQPVIASNGTLTFTPKPSATGTATVTVIAQDNGGTANGGVNTSGAQTFTITTATPPNNLPAVAVNGAGIAYTFSDTGSLATERLDFTTTVLANGNVLAAGGYNDVGSRFLNSAELYDPATGVWTAAGTFAGARTAHGACLLANGKVLLVGGDGVSSLASVQMYDPATNTWTPAASLATARGRHTTTVLPNGRVMVVGGVGATGLLKSVEIYNPVTNTWAAGASSSAFHYYHRATLLPNGKVLVAGGIGDDGYIKSAEIYDPVTNTWAAAGSLSVGRGFHTMTLLGNGKVLVAGGRDSNSVNLNSAELYDPASNVWTAAGSMTVARQSHSATVLVNGRVMVAAGYGVGRLSSVESYDPGTNTWAAAGNLTTARGGHSSSLLANGTVLVVGGQDSSQKLRSAEISALVPVIATAAEGAAATQAGTFSDLDGNATVTLTPSFGTVTKNNAAGTWNWTSPMGGDGPGSSTVTITATDSASATASAAFNFTVSNTAPTAAISAPTSANEDTSVSYSFTAADASTTDQTAGFAWSLNYEDGTGPQSVVAGTASPLVRTHIFAQPGIYTVTASATDKDGGLSAMATRQITIADITPPVLTLPGTMTRSATSANGAFVTFSVSATDNGPGTITATATPASGSTFPIGQTRVNVTATDAAGNTKTDWFVVRVTPGATPPAGNVSLTVAPLDLSGSVYPPGGVFSGLGVTASGIFDPASVGPGTYTLRYTVSGVTVEFTVTVAAPPSITPNAVTANVLAFDGVSRKVDAGPAIALANASFTIEFWAKRASVGGDHVVISEGLTSAGTNRALSLGFRANNTFTFGFNSNDLTTATADTDTGWHHWACTYNAPNRSRKIYRDGVLVASGTAAAHFQGSGNFIIGANNGGSANFFLGLLGEVRLWSTARDLRQVNAGMYSSLVGSEAGLAAFWPLDDGAGLTAQDQATGHAHPGTVSDPSGWQSAPTSFGPVFVNLNSTFTDPGATAKNAANTALTVTATNDVNTSVAGFYGVTYSATDPATGITGTCRRAVEVADLTAPAPPEILSPVNGGTVSTASTVISGLSAAGTTVTVMITGTASATPTASADVNGHFSTGGLTLPDGTYQASAVATNTLGRTSGALPAISFTHGSLPVVDAGIAPTNGGFSYSNPHFAKTHTLRNTTASPIAGPIYLLLENLSPNATPSLTVPASPMGATTRVAPLGSNYITVVPAGGSLAPGASVAITVKFLNPTNAAISYTGRVLSGGSLTP